MTSAIAETFASGCRECCPRCRAAYRQGLEVATKAGDLQTKKEIEVFLRRREKPGG
jgi:hypothetical protein